MRAERGRLVAHVQVGVWPAHDVGERTAEGQSHASIVDNDVNDGIEKSVLEHQNRARGCCTFLMVSPTLDHRLCPRVTRRDAALISLSEFHQHGHTSGDLRS